MAKAYIKIAYRRMIDASADNDFEKAVLHLSYNEFQLKSQTYNPDGKFKTFSEIRMNDGRANSLHYKSGFAIAGLINSLEKKMPAVKDALGNFIFFDTYKFEVIESDNTNKLLHKVAVTYFTNTLLLHEIIGDSVLVSAEKGSPSDEPAETFMIKMESGVSIISYQDYINSKVLQNSTAHNPGQI